MSKIIKISWERANLHIKLDKEINEKVSLIDEKKTIELGFINGDEIVISTTNTPAGEMLAEGMWSLKVGNDLVSVDEKIVHLLADKSRIFSYRGGKYAYLVDFILEEDSSFFIKTMFVRRNNKPKKFYRLDEDGTITGFVKKSIITLGVFLFNVIYKLVRLTKISKNNLLFLTENSTELSGNLKTLYDKIDKKKYKVETLCYNRYKKKPGIISLAKVTHKIAKSDFIIVDNYVQVLTHINLSKNVKIVQLWHAGIGFKSVGYARFGIAGSPHPYKSCHRKYTSAIVDKENLIDVYQEVFGCKKEIIHAYGNPRIEEYLNKDVIEQTCNRLYKMNKDLKEKKVIMFSPTYRGTGSETAYYDMNKIDLNQIGKFCMNNGFVFIIKMHSFIKEKVDIPENYKNYILDYSDLDINELIYVTDIMITDYSSCAYEYSLFNRPLIFYRYDKELYEYLRPVHTADSFTKRQYEVTSFSDLMQTLDSLKQISNKGRFDGMKDAEKRNSCEKIIKNCIGD